MKLFKNKIQIKLLFLLIVFVGCNNQDEVIERSQIKVKGEIPDQIITQFSVDFIDSSIVKAKLSAKRAYVFEDRKETILDSNVKLIFLTGSSGTKGTVLTSDSARVDDKTSNLYAYSNVKIWSDSTQTSLKTEILEWSEKDKKLYSTEYVVIDSPDEHIEGVGFESDQYLNNYKIFKVSGVRTNEK